MTTIGEKVRHVKAAGQTRKHACHWPGCTEQVPPAMWGCRKHWYALPADLRAAIWRTYKPGQEDTLTPSAEYLAAARAVQAWIAKQQQPQPHFFGSEDQWTCTCGWANHELRSKCRNCGAANG